MKTWKLNIERPTAPRKPTKPTAAEKMAWKWALPKGDEIPAGWRSAGEWRKIWGMERSRASSTVNTLFKTGKMQRRIFKVFFPNLNKLRVVPHYKLV